MQEMAKHAFDVLWRRSDFQYPRISTTDQLCAFFDGTRMVHQPTALAHKLLARACEQQAAANTVKKIEPELTFEVANLPRQGRLGDAQLPRRSRDRPKICHHYKNTGVP
jgi:hypothetical protein